MDKKIKIGPDDIFGEAGEGMETNRMMRMMILRMEKSRIRESGVPLNVLGGTQSKVEFDDVRKVMLMTVELPFHGNENWEEAKENVRIYNGEEVLVLV